ncbi:MAG: nucleotidyltransferase domain-containing protein, partial [Candidatus Vogelbacteria bacterium]|nr:nucleotidyltransferase domain-containing protein [Candidatus Vogelbacteria bacterium]
MIDQAKAKEAFESYLEKAKNDDRIVGILFGGGRAKGVATPDSDYDLILVTTDEGRAEVEQEYPKTEYVDS